MMFYDLYEKWIELEPNTGCWLWTGERNNRGYGRLNRSQGEGKRPLAHKVSFGEVPDGYELDHLCRQPACVNPKHLEPVTHAVNVARALLTDACLNGHPRTAENTYYRKDRGPNGRHCRVCAAARDAKRLNGWSRQRAARVA